MVNHKKQQLYAGAGDAARPPMIARWCGVDLVAAAEHGPQLLSTNDGRRFALLDRSVERAPGDSIEVAGISVRMQLVSMLGVVVGGDYEAWMVRSPWTTNRSWT